MNWQAYHSVFFLGIGGIGMSALARWFKIKGLRVAGYDRTPTPLTRELIEEGIEIQFDDRVEGLPDYIDKQKTLVVLTPAVPKTHQQYQYLQEQGYTMLKRAEVLGLLTRNYRTIAVAGTHGKTTTSSMIAHLLKQAGFNMVAFLGGVTANYASNLVAQGEVSENTWMVAEADEFDRSFLHLSPHLAVVTSADADHLDIYGNHRQMLDSYRQFIQQVDANGRLILHHSIEQLGSQAAAVRELYGLDRGQFFAANVTAGNGFFEFDLHGFGDKGERVRLGIPGFHNIENAVAAARVAQLVGLTTRQITDGLASFRGVKRRFEFIVRTERHVYVDDYAHHPAEIEAFLRSLRAMYPGKKITVVFQPHLFTRTRDFAEGFSQSLSLADEAIVLDIYPARELPLAGVSADMLMPAITSAWKHRCTKAEVVPLLAARPLEILATVGAGDIDTVVSSIKEMLVQREAI